ncbi:hypothetical protein MRB53_032526 [Persea americana]|uniref:Uncharacterized protein n=1 Tax=Persea americana TaxID=3435 RepID=A0ACC2KRZ7_PERAE|nr:hypothetical protein MRB53_032526 [Persea americana]
MFIDYSMPTVCSPKTNKIQIYGYSDGEVQGNLDQPGSSKSQEILTYLRTMRRAVAWIYTWGMSFGHGPTTYLGTQNGKHVNSWLSSLYPPDVSANAADSTTRRFFLIKLGSTKPLGRFQEPLLISQVFNSLSRTSIKEKF